IWVTILLNFFLFLLFIYFAHKIFSYKSLPYNIYIYIYIYIYNGSDEMYLYIQTKSSIWFKP
ncbi:MAG: hypothetical protein N7Q72_06795, partial [Spiroplasma sp. Tabriz.8]|nr:hypothetical protein [Spiroplasma sp. Tabriz.8]